MYTDVTTITRELGQFSTLLLAGLIIPAEKEGDDDVSAVEAVITDASDLIDGIIASAVTLPFVTVPKLIEKICIYLTVRKIWSMKQSKDLPVHVEKDHDNAMKLLNQIARGELKLTAADPTAETFYDLKYSAAPRTFGNAL